MIIIIFNNEWLTSPMTTDPPEIGWLFLCHFEVCQTITTKQCSALYCSIILSLYYSKLFLHIFLVAANSCIWIVFCSLFHCMVIIHTGNDHWNDVWIPDHKTNWVLKAEQLNILWLFYGMVISRDVIGRDVKEASSSLGEGLIWSFSHDSSIYYHY